MEHNIKAFQLDWLEVPTGRLIGDRGCHYDRINVLVLRLKTSGGWTGWGYGESITKGTFTYDAFWMKPPLKEGELDTFFRKEWWPKLEGRTAASLEETRKQHSTGHYYLDAAVRQALWDLMAKEAGQPLYQFMGGKKSDTRVKAYGSPLDYPLSDEQTVAKLHELMDMGFEHYKVKVGSKDLQRDIDRLKLVKKTIGSDAKITADANEGWTWQQTLNSLEAFEKNGVSLTYIEDPLHRHDVEGFTELGKRNIPVAAHDYLNDLEDVKKLIDAGIKYLRLGKDVDFVKGGVKMARKAGISVIFGNSLFEVNAHFAAAFADVTWMIEYADLDWNRALASPLQYAEGYTQIPDRPGHGFEVAPAAFEQFKPIWD